MRRAGAWALLMLAACAAQAAAEERPVVPPVKLWKDVKVEPLKDFKAPQPERIVLPNGLVLFLLEDHELPLIECAAVVRAGRVHDPADKVGLADLMGDVMRSGGSASVPGDELDRRLEDMAASIYVNIGDDSTTAGFNCLKEDLDKVLALCVDVLRRPAFPQDKLDLALTQERTQIAKRNDSPMGVAWREFSRLVNTGKDGKPSPWARYPQYETLNAITREDLAAFHAANIHPGRMIMTVMGDFDPAAMREKLTQTFGAWPAGEKAPEPPPVTLRKDEKVYVVDKPGINQTSIVMGHPLEIRRDHPDLPALTLVNEVLSGGMSARLFTEVRTKKGLAYSVRGRASANYDRPGLFSCLCLTRNEQALESIEAIRFEVKRMRDEGVTQKELDEAREGLVNSFVFNNAEPDRVAANVRTLEFYGYPLDFEKKQFEALQAVTLEQVNKAAKKYLDPEKLTMLAVGNGEALAKELAKFGKPEIVDIAIPAPPRIPLVIDPAREAEGRKLLEEAVAAAGGVKAFGELAAIRTDLVMHVGPLTLRTVMRIAVPDRVRADVAGPFGPVTQVLGRENAWQATGSWVKEIKPDEAKKNLRALTQTDLGVLRILAAGKEGYNVQALDPLREGGRVMPGVLVESASLGRVKLFLDPATKLILKLRYTLEGNPREYEKAFTGHRKYGAYTLASRIEDNDPKARSKVIELTGFTPNPKAEDALFEKPERATPPPEPEP
ncbi:MAG: insulinase family protein [Planctomycetota bacterium]|nr:insulinase family protein [Planctomycetota bacterium]